MTEVSQLPKNKQTNKQTVPIHLHLRVCWFTKAGWFPFQWSLQLSVCGFKDDFLRVFKTNKFFLIAYLETEAENKSQHDLQSECRTEGSRERMVVRNNTVSCKLDVLE